MYSAATMIQKNYRIHRHNKTALFKGDTKPLVVRHTTAKNRKPMLLLEGKGPGSKASTAYLKKRKKSKGQKRAEMISSLSNIRLL